MAIQQKLHTKLVQKLILTPSLQQAIKLLPMSTLELADLLNQEVVENPMLEEVPTEDLQPTEAAAQAEKTEAAAKEKGDAWDDSDYEYFFGDYLDDGYRPHTPQEVKELPPIENTLATSSSLSDHLLWQLSLLADDDQNREIGSAIIGNLNDDGMLVASLEEIAAMGPWPVEAVEGTLKVVQGFDPIGVAARDLQECLLLQLRHIGLEGTPTEKIVTEHLRLLQNHQVPEIAKRLGMSIEDLKEHVEIIRHLDPKPGSRYNPSQSHYVIPDVYVVKVEDQYVAVLNEEGLPQLRISPVYRRLLDKSAENTTETRAYVKDKFRSALWLIKSVEQRQKTIHKVATSIINFQRDFLDHGIEYLKPLVLRDVASDIGMHESTVSRVVTNKYMHTPQGVFEMKYFFHSRDQQLLRRERLVGHHQAAHPENHRGRRPAQAPERLEDRQHPAARRARAGPAHDREVSRGAEDSDVQSTQGAVLKHSHASTPHRPTGRNHSHAQTARRRQACQAPAPLQRRPGLGPGRALAREEPLRRRSRHARAAGSHPDRGGHGRLVEHVAHRGGQESAAAGRNRQGQVATAQADGGIAAHDVGHRGAGAALAAESVIEALLPLW